MIVGANSDSSDANGEKDLVTSTNQSDNELPLTNPIPIEEQLHAMLFLDPMPLHYCDNPPTESIPIVLEETGGVEDMNVPKGSGGGEDMNAATMDSFWAYL